MYISTKLVAAAFAVAMIALPNFAIAGGSTAPTSPSDAPSSAIADGGSDNSKVYPETGTEDFLKTRPHDGGVLCFDDPLGQHVLWIWNNSEDTLPQGTKVIMFAQPGNKKIVMTIPYNFPVDSGWIELPWGSRPDAERVSCAVTNVILPHRH